MPRVMIVDNNAFARSRLKAIFEDLGWDIAGEAATGEEAVESYRLLDPDVVTMGVAMPEMDGISAAREIKKNDPEAKVIVVSALASQKDIVEEAVEAGAATCVPKPFSSEEIVKALKALER